MIQSKISSFVLAFLLVATFAEASNEWGYRTLKKKNYTTQKEQTKYQRRRVDISSRTKFSAQPIIKDADVGFSKAREFLKEKKTRELINQLEKLIRRKGQKKKQGELKMRLAELYYEQAQLIGRREGENWNTSVLKWEALPETKRAKTKRPVLRTPQADSVRKRSLKLYHQLEKDSRGRDQGRSKLIRRDETLFFLGSTYKDLRKYKSAKKYLYELVTKFSRSQRAYSGRLQLADVYFDERKYKSAIKYYLNVAGGKGARPDLVHLRPYAFYKLGWSYFNTNQFSKAIASYKKTIEHSKKAGSERKITFVREARAELIKAYAFSGKFLEGETYFKKVGDNELLGRYYRVAAETAKDLGKFKIANRFYKEIIDSNPSSVEARESYLQIVEMSQQKGHKTYIKALDNFAKKFGAKSSWIRKQEKEQREFFVRDLVNLLRRETKFYHNLSQKKSTHRLKEAAHDFYAVYFKHVPKPNSEIKENLHEMKFFYAELLYELGKYSQAAKRYSLVGEGAYRVPSDYARVLALQKLSEADGRYTKNFLQATRDFQKSYPKDPRNAELLYMSSYLAFKKGDSKTALSGLNEVVVKYPNSSRSVEAAERVLFILEKKGDVAKVSTLAAKYAQNKALVATGGAAFVHRLNDIKQKSVFKRIDNLPHNTAKEQTYKSKAYYSLSKKLKGPLKEKALNNSLVYADKSGDPKLQKGVRTELLRYFPKSKYAKNIYLKEAESDLKDGDWAQSMGSYARFEKIYPNDSRGAEVAWNQIYIQGHLDRVWRAQLNPRFAMSKYLVGKTFNFVKNFSRSKERNKAIELLAFRKGASVSQVALLRKQKALTKEQHSTIDVAEAAAKVRRGRLSDLRALVKKYRAQASHSPLFKEILAQAKFKTLEAEFQNFSRKRLSYSANSFASSIKSKLSALEKLEKQYLEVVKYGNGDWALKSLDRLSDSYHQLAINIEKAPGIKKEDLAPFTSPLYQKSVDFLKICMQKAAEIRVAGAVRSTCRAKLSARAPNELRLQQHKLMNPQWQPNTSFRGSSSLFNKTIAAYKNRRIGEFELGADYAIVQGLPEREQSYLMSLQGIVAWKNKRVLDAESFFQKAKVTKENVLKKIASKNLAALYLQVGAYDEVKAQCAPYVNSDSSCALMVGTAEHANKNYKEAVAVFNRGISKNSKESRLYFNKALSQASMGQRKEASLTMQKYIQLQVKNPSELDLSRKLIKQWKVGQ